MALTVQVIPGAQLGPDDKLTNSIFNLGAQPTVIVTGDIEQLDNVNSTPGEDNQPLVYDTDTEEWLAGTVGNLYVEPFDGATSGANGTTGGVPAPLAGEQGTFLRGDGTWAVPNPASATNSDLFAAFNLY